MHTFFHLILLFLLAVVVVMLLHICEMGTAFHLNSMSYSKCYNTSYSGTDQMFWSLRSCISRTLTSVPELSRGFMQAGPIGGRFLSRAKPLHQSELFVPLAER